MSDQTKTLEQMYCEQIDLHIRVNAQLASDVEAMVKERDELRSRLDGIRDIIDTVENRCMAADGPVSNTRREMDDKELRQIYKLSKVKR